MNNRDKSGVHDYFLWKRFKNSDKDALSQIYKSNYSVLYDYGYRFLGNHAVARECIQRLFFNLISNIDTLPTPRNTRSFLLASLRKRIFNRINQDHSNNVTGDKSEYSFELIISQKDLLIDKENNALRKPEVKLKINNLPAREKELIYLKISKNMKYGEIAEIMGIDSDSARKLVKKAISEIKDLCGVWIKAHN